MFRTIALLVFIPFFLPNSIQAQNYASDVWVNHRYPGEIQTIEFTRNQVYIFCDYGIYIYNRFNRTWQIPLTKNPIFGNSFFTKKRFDKPILINNYNLGIYSESDYYEFDDIWGNWIKRNQPLYRPLNDSIPIENEQMNRWIAPSGWTILPDGKLLSPYQSYFRVRSAVTDDRGDTWWIINRVGLATGNTSTRRLSFERLGISEPITKSIAKNKDYLYVGHANRGLSIMDRNSRQWSWIEPLQSGFDFSNGDIRSIQLTQDNNLILATAHGVVFTSSNDTKNWRRIGPTQGLSSHQVKDILTFEGKTAVATDNGFDIIEKDRKVKNVLSFLSEPVEVNDLTQSNSMIFAATSIGLVMLQKQGFYVAFIENPTEFNSQNWNVVEWHESELWCANDEGLVVIDLMRNQSTIWRTFQQFENSKITSIAVHPEMTWVGTTNGLYRVDRRLIEDSNQLSFRPRIHRYNQEKDGLLSNEIHQMTIEDDTLFIATNDGITVFKFLKNDKIQE